jgi:hypothetical protein
VSEGYTAGQEVAGWTLLDGLGEGGNGKVWHARKGSDEAALKILHTQHQSAESKRYLRFKLEVEGQQRLIALRVQGVMPIIDASMPSAPTDANPAWLAMPLAVPIRKALGAEPATLQVVEAVASIAETLAAMHEQGFSHRDLKPSNLYRLGSEWVVGDFGLVDYPGKDGVTSQSERIGSVHFIAPEMMSDAADIDGRPADVYSLAKTLYVLTTGQTFPPPGQHRVDLPGMTVSDFVPGPRAVFLDRLIERGTNLDPRARPSMQQLAAELRECLRTAADPSVPALPRNMGKYIAKLNQWVADLDAPRLTRIRLAREAFDRVNERTIRLMRTFAGYTKSGNDGTGDIQQWRHLVLPDIRAQAHDWAEVTGFGETSRGASAILVGGGAGVLLRGDRVVVHVGYYKDDPTQVPRATEIWSGQIEADVGSAAMDNSLSELLNAWSGRLPSALHAYREALQRRLPPRR